MAYRYREDIVGKRFLCVDGRVKKLNQKKINHKNELNAENHGRDDEFEREPRLWRWRCGVVRAATHRNNTHPELQLLLEYDDSDWEDRHWVNVHEEGVFRVFLLEHSLVWVERRSSHWLSPARTAPTRHWPALAFTALVNRTKVGFGSGNGSWGRKASKVTESDDADDAVIGTESDALVPVEFLDDKQRDFVASDHLRPFAEWELFGLPVAAGDDYGASGLVGDCSHVTSRGGPTKEAVRQWAESQAGQRILVTTPSIVVGYRVQVYRAEGTTQWYTAVIVGNDESQGELALIDDTVLEEHYEDPRLLQMRLIGEGVVSSILRGETTGITPRRSRATAQAKLGNAALQSRASGKRSPEKRKLCKTPCLRKDRRKVRTNQDRPEAGSPKTEEAEPEDEIEPISVDQKSRPQPPTGLAGGSPSGLVVIPVRNEKDADSMNRDRSELSSSNNSSSSSNRKESPAAAVTRSSPSGMSKKSEAAYPPGFISPYALAAAAQHHSAAQIPYPGLGSQQAAAAAEMLWKSAVTQLGTQLGGSTYPGPGSNPTREELMVAQARERERQERHARERKEMKERDRLEMDRQEKERQEQAVQLHFEESLRLAQQKMGVTNYSKSHPSAKPSPAHGPPRPAHPTNHSHSAARGGGPPPPSAAERHVQRIPSSSALSVPSNQYPALPRADLNFSVMGYQTSRKADHPEIRGLGGGGGGVIVSPAESRDTRPSGQVTFKPYETNASAPRQSPSSSGRSSRSPLAMSSTPPLTTPLGYHSPSPNRGVPQGSYSMPPPSVSPSRSPAGFGPAYAYSPMYNSPVPSTSPSPGGVKNKAMTPGITSGLPLRRPSPDQVLPLPLTSSAKEEAKQPTPRTAFSPMSQPLPPPQQSQPLDLGPSYRDEVPIALVTSSRSADVQAKPKTEIPLGFPSLTNQPMMSVAALIDAANAAAAQGKSSGGPVSSPVKIEAPTPLVVKAEPIETQQRIEEPANPVEVKPSPPISGPPAASGRPVHKLKTAWLQRHAGGDETPVKLTNIPEVKAERDSCSPSPAKMARKNAAVASFDHRLNGIATSPVAVTVADDSDPPPTALASGRGRKRRGGAVATPLGRRIGAKSRNSATAAVAAVVAAAGGGSSSGSDSDNASDSDGDSSASMKGRRAARDTRIPAGRGVGRPRSSDSSSSKDSATQKRGRGSSVSVTEKSSNSSNPFNKPSVAQLKKTGESFLQDGACWEVAPRLGKCRECRLTPHQRRRTEQQNANIFCRFYAFRRLRYTKSGQLAVAGFSHPVTDAGEDDKRLWLPQPDQAPKDLDVDMSAFLVTHVGDQFCLMVQQERKSMAEALNLKGADGDVVHQQIAWKRVVQGVREMCDVCETTLFNFHWACGKCGYVVCIDCYNSRCAAETQTNGSSARDDEKEEKDKDHDSFGWLYCTSRSGHDPIKLMPTQIIAGEALETMGHLIHVVRYQWGITQFCDCPIIKEIQQTSLPATNGVSKELKIANGSSKSDSAENGDRLANGNGCDVDSEGVSDDDGGDGFSTLRELLIRPSQKPQDGKESSPTHMGSPPSPKKPKANRLKTLEDVISCVIERGVNKEAAGDSVQVKGEEDSSAQAQQQQNPPMELKHFKRRCDVLHAVRTREPLPLRIMVHAESAALYPNVPHSWLCNGRLLRLHEPLNPNNYKIFQDQWKRGQPVIISGVHSLLDKNLWHPDSFCRDFGDSKNDLINCLTGNLVPNQPMRKFWEGFERLTKRLKDDKGQPMLLKLKDWPPGDDFAEVLPTRFADLMKSLPVGEYTKRNGRLNLAGRLPDCFVRPDLGPKMYNAYGAPQFSDKGTTNLHLDVSDAANVMVYVGTPKELNAEDCMKDALRAIDEGGCDPLTRQRVRESGELPGAMWHIYHARDADRIRDFLNKVALERGVRLEPHHDPIHDQSCYLDGPLRARLYQEYGVSGYAIVQCLGDTVFIPAGAPHQVRNLHSCIKVAEDFVSPENVAHCFQMTQEFRILSDNHTNHEDKLQIKNVIYHAIKDSLAVLASQRPLPAPLLRRLDCKRQSTSTDEQPH